MTPQHYLAIGNRAMAISGGAMLLGVGVAYPFAHHFGLLLQVLAHLAIPVAAGVFKLGYVLRLAAQHALAPAAPAVPARRTRRVAAARPVLVHGGAGLVAA